MTNLVRLDVGPQAPPDLAKQLRDLADAVERGEVTGMVAGFVTSGNFDFLYAASLRECLELATLLQNRCIKRYEV